MKAICDDGTRIECKSFETTEAGLHLFADEDHEQGIGFVPITKLRYILPDDVEPAALAAQPTMQPQAASQQAPPTGVPQPTMGQQPVQSSPQQQSQSGVQRR